jgi:Ras-related protein Rab-32
MEQKKDSEPLYKVMVVGDIGVGKTSFVRRLVHNIFSIHYKATIGVDFGMKVVQGICRLQLWDIAGQERFGNMTRTYFRESVGAFIIVDATRPSTFDGAKKWKTLLDVEFDRCEMYPDEFYPVILLVNKIDLLDTEAQNNINYDEFCKENRFHSWIAVSSKDDIGIQEAGLAMVNICKTAKLPDPVLVEKEDELKLCEKKGANEEIREKETTCADFLVGIITELDRLQDDGYKIKRVRTALFSVFFSAEPTAKKFREKIQSDERTKCVIKGINDILTESSIDDSHKVTSLLNFILECGMRFLEPVENTVDDDYMLQEIIAFTSGNPSISVKVERLEDFLTFCKKYPDNFEKLKVFLMERIIDIKLSPHW